MLNGLTVGAVFLVVHQIFSVDSFHLSCLAEQK
jgi:hypothetical protein